MRRDGYGIRISDFLELDTMTGVSLLTFVVDGTNYKIPYSDFVAGLGVTGSLEQIGDGLVNILDTQGTVNYIRNIESGPGVLAEITPDEGIKISQNFDVNADGSPLMLNPTADSPTLVSLVAGSGITLTEVGDTIVISLT